MDRLEYIESQIKKENIDSAWLEFVRSDKPAIIYGAGRQARIVIDFCHMFEKEIFCLMATDSKKRWGLLPREEEMPLFLAHEFPDGYDKEGYDVIIALHSKWNEEITASLRARGFKRIYAVLDWERENLAIRDAYYRHYFYYYGAEFQQDSDGETYLNYRSKEGRLSIYYPQDPVFRANTFGELGNIVMPSLFGDESASCLGPYEYGSEIQLKKGQVVFDLGANVGLFSCVAAAKGCRVYAFEPEEVPVYSYLKKNAGLNPNIKVVPYAVGKSSGMADFYFNNHLDTDYDTCQSSIHPELNPSFDKISVPMITLDDFVEREQIGHVDFIKSHIEYTEDDMLEGAQMLIQRDAPILSFYSQKALGNERYKKIEELILKANPKYHILYYKRRVYAYIPE